MTILEIIAACESEAGRLLRAASILRGDDQAAPVKPARRTKTLAKAVKAPRRLSVRETAAVLNAEPEPKAGKHDQRILHVLEASPVGLRCSDIARAMDPRDKSLLQKAFIALKRMTVTGVVTKEAGGIYKIAAALLAVLLLATPALAADVSWYDLGANSAIASAGILGFTEIVFTERCIQAGTCHEVNPLLPHGADNGAALGRTLLKGVGVAVGVRVLLELKDPRFGKTGKVAAVVGALGLAAWNGYLTKRSFDAGRTP